MYARSNTYMKSSEEVHKPAAAKFTEKGLLL